MQIKNNTRIQTSIGKATIWPISPYYYTVVYDYGDAVIVGKERADKLIEEGAWQVIDNNPYMDYVNNLEKGDLSLVQEFKFKLNNTVPAFDILYTYKKSDDMSDNVFWDNDEQSEYYPLSDVERHVANGDWIIVHKVPFDDYTVKLNNDEEMTFTESVQYKQGDKVDIGNLKIEIDTSEIRKEFDEIIDGAILAKIKSFTTSFDADVMIVNGAYIVFDNLSETSYKASTEDDLVKIFGAFDVLAEFADG